MKNKYERALLDGTNWKPDFLMIALDCEEPYTTIRDRTKKLLKNNKLKVKITVSK